MGTNFIKLSQMYPQKLQQRPDESLFLSYALRVNYLKMLAFSTPWFIQHKPLNIRHTLSMVLFIVFLQTHDCIGFNTDKYVTINVLEFLYTGRNLNDCRRYYSIIMSSAVVINVCRYSRHLIQPVKLWIGLMYLYISLTLLRRTINRKPNQRLRECVGSVNMSNTPTEVKLLSLFWTAGHQLRQLTNHR